MGSARAQGACAPPEVKWQWAFRQAAPLLQGQRAKAETLAKRGTLVSPSHKRDLKKHHREGQVDPFGVCLLAKPLAEVGASLPWIRDFVQKTGESLSSKGTVNPSGLAHPSPTRRVRAQQLFSPPPPPQKKKGGGGGVRRQRTL